MNPATTTPAPTWPSLLRGLVAGGLIVLLLMLPTKPRAEEHDVLVFAAASLKHALDRVSSQYKTRTGKVAAISYAASSTLAKQIAAGAPADVFISADLDWMDFLAERNLIVPGTRVTLLANTLVLIAPADSALDLPIAPNFSLAQALDKERLAIAEPSSVPAGKYAKAALTHLGVWSEVEGKLAPADNVAAALLLVARKEAPLGIVYATDALAEPRVRIVGTFPPDTHPPIVYPAAMTAHSERPTAPDFLEFLKSGESSAIFKALGFRTFD